MKLEPRFTKRFWIEETTIDTEFGKVKITQDKITHHSRIKDSIDKCFQNARVGSSLPGLLCKFFKNYIF